jgi:plasmid stabilization system protein ParE
MIWSDLARLDLRDLHRRIAKTAPKGARVYLQKLKAEASRLRRAPESGWIVEEINEPDIREIVYDRYRVL